MPRKVDSLSKPRPKSVLSDKPPSGNKKEDTYASMFPEPSVVIEGPPKWIWWLVFMVFGLLLTYLGIQSLNGRLDKWLTLGNSRTQIAPSSPELSSIISPSSPPLSTPISTPESSPSSTPTATPSPDWTLIKIRILNGTFQNGAAAKARFVLEQAGFKVRTIGNAQSQTYQTTIVYYLDGKQSEAELVKTALSNYMVTLEQSTLASPDDVLIVIGTK